MNWMDLTDIVLAGGNYDAATKIEECHGLTKLEFLQNSRTVEVSIYERKTRLLYYSFEPLFRNSVVLSNPYL